MSKGLRSAFTTQGETSAAGEDILRQFADMEPSAVIFFNSPRLDGAALARAIRGRFPAAEVIGCTTAGEFTNERSFNGGVSALALGPETARRAAGALARFDGGTVAGIQAATTRIADTLAVELRACDPERYVGVVLFEGLRMQEETANEALGNIAPLLSFVGASAGDDLSFKVTHVYHNEEESVHGAALLLLDMAVPFVVGKTCSFKPIGPRWMVTRADPAQRVVYELDGQPVLPTYAAALGTTPDRLGSQSFMVNPLGLMIDGQPWIRSPQRVVEGGGLKFFCRIDEGEEVHLMESTDLVLETQKAFDKAQEDLGRPIAGGLGFNCLLRRLEMDAKGLHEGFLKTLQGRQIAGFHTYGESWLGHINQTLTALWIG